MVNFILKLFRIDFSLFVASRFKSRYPATVCLSVTCEPYSTYRILPGFGNKYRGWGKRQASIHLGIGKVVFFIIFMKHFTFPPAIGFHKFQDDKIWISL